MQIKAFIYCRVSSQRQVDEGHGLEGQEKRCRDYAKGKGYRVVDVYRDEGVSGGLIEREGMQRLQKALEEYKSELDKSVVIVDDIKRLARDVEAHFELKRAIYTRNAVLESPSHRFEDTPGGKFVETMLAAHAELERSENRVQVINRMRARLESGYWSFCMPKGVINKKDPIHGKVLVRREPYASIYKEGIEKFRDGALLTIDDFQAFCNEKYKECGITHKMSHSTATETLKEILYTGYLEYSKWNIPRMKAKHEGFITLETYEAVQERLQGRAKPWHRKDYNLDFPLRPHVLCDNCGIPMSGAFNTGRNGTRHPHYYCRGKGCKYIWKTIRKAEFEAEFESLLLKTKPVDEVIDLAKTVLLTEWNNRQENYVLVKNNMQGELNKIQGEIDGFVEKAGKAREQSLIDIYEGKIKELADRKKELEKQLRQDNYTDKDFGTATEKVFNVLKTPLDMWQSDNYNDKRAILFMYFEDKLRYDYKTGFGTTSLAYPISLITKKPPVKEASVDKDQISWNRIEAYIFKWYPILQIMNLARL